MEDQSWRSKPAIMSEGTFDAALIQITEYCKVRSLSRAIVVFHGGEPCLVGLARFRYMCEKLQTQLSFVQDLHIVIQTNGTLINEGWAQSFADYNVEIGLSLDGPPAVNDLNRHDHKGRGSYERVITGLKILQSRGLEPAIMCVIPIGADPISVHHHFLSLACRTITYLLPHFNHDNVEAVFKRWGTTPCADFLIPIFEDWWENSTTDICIRDLENIARIIMGGQSRIDTFGSVPPSYVFIETDGTLEGLDNLKSCMPSMACTDLSVHAMGLESFDKLNGAAWRACTIPDGCKSCAESETCTGGYLPHRFSQANGFNNPSVWCRDIFKLFQHIRRRLDVTAQETSSRKSMVANH